MISFLIGLLIIISILVLVMLGVILLPMAIDAQDDLFTRSCDYCDTPNNTNTKADKCSI